MNNKKKFLPLFILPLLVLLFLFSQNNHRKNTTVKQEFEENNRIEEKDREETTEEVKEEKVKLTVDIKGQVENPGIYTLVEGSRVMDVIHAAGGLLDNANTSLINLSKKIEDEMVIIIYSNEEMDSLMKEEKIVYKIVEVEKECPDSMNNACINEKKGEEKNNHYEEVQEEMKLVNLNTATLDELTTLPGIGEAKAEKIIAYREIFPFENIEQLKEVSGIGEALFEKIKDHITI